MADEESLELLSCIFTFGTFAYKRVAQGSNRSLSMFRSLFRNYFYGIVKAERCAQYVDDLRVAAHTTHRLISNMEHVFQGFDLAGVKLSMDKCYFGQFKIDFSGKTMSCQGISLVEHNLDSFQKNPKNAQISQINAKLNQFW